jgi:acetyl esterase/lipase
MSLQAELIRVAARLFIRPGNHPEASVAVQHERMRSYERWVPRPPEGTETIYKPLGTIPAFRVARAGARPSRIILFLHGGGYVTGSPTLYQHVTWRFAAAARAQLIAIDYRLAPAHPFPAAINDAAVAWRALLAEGALAQRCAILGDSAGGGLALALAMRLRDEGVPLPGAVVALSPWTDLAITGLSSKPGTADPMLKASDLDAFAAHYVNGSDPREPYISPLYGDPRGLPPTLLQVGSDEILRDDSERMATRMREAGCDVTLEVWPRMPHVWHAFAPMMPEARRAIARVGAFIEEKTA